MRPNIDRASTLAIALTLASALQLSPTAAQAQSDGSGFEGGLRLGYAVPLGKVTGDSGDDLNEGISGQIPLWLDLGYRVNPNLFVGLYAHYGFGIVGGMIDDACSASSQVDCSASDIRLGPEVHYHVNPEGTADPWFGAGLGLEWMTLGVEGGGAEFSTTAFGFEFLNLQAGLDIKAAEHVVLGPFLSFSFDQFSSLSVDCSGPIDCSMFGGLDGDIENKSLHEWFTFGVRAAYIP